MPDGVYSLLISTIGLPYGYRAVAYEIDGRRYYSMYTASVLTQHYRIKRVIVVGLAGVGYPSKNSEDSIRSRIDELEAVLRGSSSDIFASLPEEEREAYKRALEEELKIKKRFIDEKPEDIYRFFLSQEGFSLRSEDPQPDIIYVTQSDIPVKVAERVIDALSGEKEEQVNVLLDISHGLNWLPLQTERGVELGLKASSFSFSKKIMLEIVSSENKEKPADLRMPEKEQLTRFATLTFSEERSLKEAVWQLMGSYGKMRLIPLLAFFLEISAPLAVTKLISENWSEVEGEFSGSTEEIGVVARAFSCWLRNAVKGLWVPESGMSERALSDFVGRVIKAINPLGEELLRDQVKRLKDIKLKSRAYSELRNHGRLRLCYLIRDASDLSTSCSAHCKDRQDFSAFDIRNFIAHSGFEESSVCVKHSIIDGQETLSYYYDPSSWEKILKEAEEYLKKISPR
ncbi:MAG: TM1812 family CRISPR-associated protein [Nitrososphaeria archaeon]